MKTPEQEYAFELLTLILDLFKEQLYHPLDIPFEYTIKLGDGLPDPEQQFQLLLRLAHKGAVELDVISTDAHENYIYEGSPPITATKFSVELKHPQIDELRERLSSVSIDSKKDDDIIEVNLIKDDVYLLLETEEGFSQRVKKFNPDMQLDSLMTYVINRRAGKDVSIQQLRNSGIGLSELKDIRETMRKGGLAALRPYFFPVWQKDLVKVETNANMTTNQLKALVIEMTAKNRQKSQ